MKQKYLVGANEIPFTWSPLVNFLKKLIRLYLYSYDFLTSYKKNTNNQYTQASNPQKIIISNIAYLGDVVITTSIIPIIKKNFPKAKIFFLGNSYTKSFIKNHNLIDEFLSFDHMRLNRKKISFLKKILNHYISKRKVIKQLKKEKINLAIDFYFYNPNSIKLLHKAKIPNIIGYTNGGYKNLLTMKLNKPINPFWHMSEYHLNLLNLILKEKEKLRPLEPDLPVINEPMHEQLKNYVSKNFVLIHPGAGQKRRYLNVNEAQKILKIIPKDDLVLFVGNGQDENNLIEEIIKGRNNCINLSNKLHILDIIYLCKNAKLVITTDSAIAHIASTFNNPQIVLFNNPSSGHQNLWCLNKPNIKVCEI